MWPFKRKNNENKGVPAEIKQYYASEHRERVGLAWLIAFLSLILTVAIIAGLFFGGRWAYRKIAHKNNVPQSVGEGTGEEPAPSSTSSSSGQSKPNDLQPAVPAPGNGGKIVVPKQSAPTSTPKATNLSPQTSSIYTTTPAQATNNQSTTQSGQSNASQPTTGKSNEITNTGPGNTLAIFIAVTLIAALGHMQYQRQRINKLQKTEYNPKFLKR